MAGGNGSGGYGIRSSWEARGNHILHGRCFSRNKKNTKRGSGTAPFNQPPGRKGILECGTA